MILKNNGDRMKTERNSDAFIGSENVDGGIFKKRVGDIPDNLFCTKGINTLIKHLGIKIDGLTYVKPRIDTPCMYGQMTIFNKPIGLESYYSWKDIIRMKKDNPDGVFIIFIYIMNETSFLENVTVSWSVENLPIESVKMSPLVDKLELAS